MAHEASTTPDALQRPMLPSLSKSKFQYGLQCLKRLYLYSYQWELSDPVDESLQAVFDTGNDVGELARERFLGGRLIEESHKKHDQAVKTTAALLADAEVPPLYEAAFTFEDINTRVDVLKRGKGQAFDLVEVKSSTQVKPEHVTDVAIQMHVVEGAGTPVSRAYLMHINRGYVYQGGDHDLEELFTLEDVTDRVRKFIDECVPDNLSQMWAALQASSPPDIAIGPHCKKPYVCSFYGHCHQGEVAQTGAASVSPNLGSSLEEITFPASFLDFETFNPAIPLYVGTRPYQRIPFQWSLHVLDASGEVRHHSFLNGDAEDPRENFIVSLLEAIPSAGAIVVYTHFESSTLKDLARAFPAYEERLLALCDRMVDLYKIIRGNYSNPGFGGSYSLKAVVPVLAPDLSHTDLAIQEGGAASARYAAIIAAGAQEADKAKTREDLLAYCARDTEVMIGVYKALTRIAG